MTYRWTQKEKFLILQKSWAEIERQICIMELGTATNFNQFLNIGKLSIYNENKNMMNVIWNARYWETGMFFGIGETDSQGCIWMVDTRVTDIPFMLSFPAKIKNVDLYWVHVNNLLLNKMKYKNQC